MTLKMKNKLDDAKVKYFNTLKQDDINPEEFANVQTEYFEAIAEQASEQVKAEYEAFKRQVGGDDILARRGMNALTPEERTLMNSPTANVRIVNTGVAVAVTVTNDPVHTKTTASEIVLPSYERMDSTYVIKCY